MGGHFVGGILVGAFTATFIAVIIVASNPGGTVSGNWREAISRGYAEYCPKDGTFEWKGECK